MTASKQITKTITAVGTTVTTVGVIQVIKGVKGHVFSSSSSKSIRI